MTLSYPAARSRPSQPLGTWSRQVLRASFRLAFILLRFAWRSVALGSGNIAPERARAILQSYDADPNSSSLAAKRPIHCENDLTIIIAAFNAEKYIKACIESIVAQETQYAITIVVVNDGSTDGTGRILQSYAETGKINLIEQQNRGLSEARNAGLNIASSKYVLFLDADDVLAENALNILLRAGQDTGADIVTGSYYRFDSGGMTEIYTADDRVYLRALGNIPGFACMKLIRSDLLAGLRFPPGYWYEDTMLSYLVYPRCRNVVSLSAMIYGYRVNPDSITARTVHSHKAIDSYWIFERLQKDMDEFGVIPDQSIYELCVDHLILTCRRLKREARVVKTSAFHLASDQLKRRYSKFNTKRGVAYKLIEFSLRRNKFALYEMACEFVRLGDGRLRFVRMPGGATYAAAEATAAGARHWLGPQ